MDQSVDTEFRALLDRRIRGNRERLAWLKERQAEIAGELAATEERLRRETELYVSEFGADPETSAARSVVSDEVVDGRRPSGLAAAGHEAEGRFTGLSWSDAITSALAAADAPLHVKQLWQILREGGFRTETRDPIRSIVAIAVRNPNLLRVAPNTYRLALTRQTQLAVEAERREDSTSHERL